MTLLLLLLLELPAHESPLKQDRRPFEYEPCERSDVFESGHDLRLSYGAELLTRLLFSLSLFCFPNAFVRSDCREKLPFKRLGLLEFSPNGPCELVSD